MSDPKPAVSVLMSAHNAVGYIDECLDSIAAQSFEDFELVCFDDGSTDGTADRIDARSQEDARFRAYRRPRRGLVSMLNEGLSLCRSGVIVRMDADDYMHPDRLRIQLEYLAAHPDIDVVGSRVEAFPADELAGGMLEYLRWQNACVSPESIANDIYLESPLTQPSVTFRRGPVLASGGYRDGDFPEDYELWLRLFHAGCRFGKCPEVLLRWRQRLDSYSRADPRFSRDAFDKLRAEYLSADPRMKSAEALAFWGAGRVTRKRCRHLIGRGFAPRVWVDIDPKKIGGRIGGAPVVSPEWLAAQGPRSTRPLVLVFVASHGARALIAERLDQMNYRPGRDYLMVG